MDNKIKYLLHLADNNLILGQRLGEWCGHGPVLEQDIAMTNMALDLIGQSRLLYQYAVELLDDGSTEDTLAMTRPSHEYYNCLLVEQPNGNWGDTIMRQFLYDTFSYYNYKLLTSSGDEHLAAIAEKSLKEVSYHLRFSSEWVIRLGDGTEESRNKMQAALNDLWAYTGELHTPVGYEEAMHAEGIAPDVRQLKDNWSEKAYNVLREATLAIPDTPWMHNGGKTGVHTEHHGYILAELQYMQRAYPNLQW